MIRIETFQEQIERIKNRAAELRERFRGRFENRGRPFHWAQHGPHAGRAIAVGKVTDISVSSITVGEKTFVVADETQLPQNLESGDFVVVHGESTDGELVAISIH